MIPMNLAKICEEVGCQMAIDYGFSPSQYYCTKECPYVDLEKRSFGSGPVPGVPEGEPPVQPKDGPI